MSTTKHKPACAECRYLGFLIINNDEDHPEVQACDCGHFATDADAGEALDEFIRKHAPKVRRDTPSLPAGYTLHRSVSGAYRWRFEVNSTMPDGQRPDMDRVEARQAAWDHWTKAGNAASRALPLPLGMERP